jgi:hypothetical protein
LRSYDPRMPVWRCPHCNTPQSESSRCWVCRRSTTSCATCRHYRKGVAGGLGLCGLDPKHVALRGTEMRPCWVAAPPPVDAERRWAGSTYVRIPGDAVGRAVTAASVGVASMGSAAAADARGIRRPRTFVPVEDPGAPGAGNPGGGGPSGDPGEAEERRTAPSPVTLVPGTWWLWGDPEPWPEG